MKITAILIAAMVIFSGTSCLAGGIRIGDTTAARIAKDPSLLGKGKSGQCVPFALALHKEFEAAGIESRVIVYGYEGGGVPAMTTYGDIVAQPAGGPAARGSHAVVVYNDGGRTYVMDNQLWTPQWIRNATPVQMAQQFSGINYSVKMARVISTDRTSRTLGLPNSTRRIAAN